MELKNRTILITGGTSGIGNELVRQLAPRNGTLIVLGRNPVKLEGLRKEFNNVSTYLCDLASATDLERAICDIRNENPHISVVINNAGIQETPTFLHKNFCYNSIQSEIDINLTASIKICALMLGNLLALSQSSAFVNVTSGLALFPKKSSAVYCATKAGLRNFSTSFRYQLEETSVRVFEAILPIVDTPMTEGRGQGKISASNAAAAIITGVERDRHEIYIGKSRLLPLLARISPSMVANIMKSN